jgi:hypothetical protein
MVLTVEFAGEFDWLYLKVLCAGAFIFLLPLLYGNYQILPVFYAQGTEFSARSR